MLDRPGRARIQDILRATAAFLAVGMDEGALARQEPNHLALSIVGLHLTCFAAPEVSGALLGDDLFDPAQVAARQSAVREQVRRLCGIRSLG